MTSKRRNLGLSIEGMGSSVSSTAGIMWNFGAATIGTPGNYEWTGGVGKGAGLVSAPDSVGCSVDPFECELRGNGHTFTLHGTKQAKALFFARPIEPRDALNAVVDDDATTIVFALAGNYTWSASDDATVVWIGDEAIKLGTFQAGGTFTGCVRGYWSTTGMLQPAGMNVFHLNPKVQNRLARLWVYDRDAGTTTQAWQGFVRSYKASGPIITVQCQDIWSSIRNAEINRKGKRVAGGFAFGGNAGAQGSLDWMDAPPDGFSGRRVNKANATRPHWIASQAYGALWYSKLDSTGVATLLDADGLSIGGSFPQLGSVGDLEAGGAGYELLVVDRTKDQADGADAAYADMRSSTRDLDEPFHPVAISMAILTSGYDTYPAGTTPAEFGTSVTLKQTKAQYFSGTYPSVQSMSAVGLTDQCAIMANQGHDTDSPVKLIPCDGGAAVWTMTATPLATTHLGQNGGLVTTSDYVFAWLDGEDGTYNGSNWLLACRIGVSDGVIDWGRGYGDWSCGGRHALAYAPVLGDTVTIRNSTTAEVIYTDDTGTKVGDSDDTNAADALAAGFADDESMFFVAGGNGTIGAKVASWSIPYSDNDARDTTLDLEAGSDTTLTWSGFDNSDSVHIVADRNGDGAWICQGAASALNEPYVMHITTGSGTPSVDIEIDCADNWGFASAGTYNQVVDIAADKYGHLYVLVSDAFTNPSEVDILRYDEAGNFIYSALADGVTLPTGSDDDPHSIAVDEEGNIYLGDEGGYVWAYSQT